MVIVTDGQENASKQFTKSDITKMIDEKKRENNWTYVYLSSDLSTQIQGNNIGLQESITTSNCQVSHKKFGDFIGHTLNNAIKISRETGITVQCQLNGAL
jgi:hypothetical protein